MRVGERRGAYMVLVGKPEGKMPLGTLRWRWEDNIKMGIQETGRGAWSRLIGLRIRTSGRML